MRADALNHRFPEPEEQKRENDRAQKPLMTPARRAALDALEREFNALIKAAAAATR